MSHVTPKEIVTVQYIGEARTRFTPFIGGEKIDIEPNQKVEMDARQAAVVLIDHLRWKKISERKNDEASADKPEAKVEDKKTAKKK